MMPRCVSKAGLFFSNIRWKKKTDNFRPREIIDLAFVLLSRLVVG